jgi:hypothetical protein
MAEGPPQREPSRCFVIMPIGREETDRVWAEAYEPTIKASGLDPFRIDKRDDGGLLTQQIVHQIQVSHLLIADLPFARPNCYYELGFAHGVNRSFRVVLCCREDHLADSLATIVRTRSTSTFRTTVFCSGARLTFNHSSSLSGNESSSVSISSGVRRPLNGMQNGDERHTSVRSRSLLLVTSERRSRNGSSS